MGERGGRGNKEEERAGEGEWEEGGIKKTREKLHQLKNGTRQITFLGREGAGGGISPLLISEMPWGCHTSNIQNCFCFSI